MSESELPVGEQGLRPAEPPAAPQPTEQDCENERVRRAIAERMEAEYAECLALALKAFGAGWMPSCRHYLVDKDDEDR